MTQSVPTKEPAFITAGDSIVWKKSLPNYPASAGWILRYRLIKPDGKLDFSASASADDHLVQIAASVTATWPAGAYAFQAYVDGVASKRHTIGTGNIILKPNLAAQSGGYDGRSSAKKTLELLDAAMVEQGANAWTAEYDIGNRRMKFLSPGDFIKFRNKLQAEVAREVAAERLAAGLPSKSRVLVRF